MKDLKSIFNHPPKSTPEKDPHLYDWKRPFHSKNDAAYLNKLLKAHSLKKSPERFPSGRTRLNGNANNRKQRVMFKMSYGNSMDKHKKYIKLYMPQIGKDGVEIPREIFGTDLNEYLKHMTPFHLKLIISPESQKIDLKLLSEAFIRHLEKSTGYEFYWLGTIHTDTEHIMFIWQLTEKTRTAKRFDSQKI